MNNISQTSLSGSFGNTSSGTSTSDSMDQAKFEPIGKSPAQPGSPSARIGGTFGKKEENGISLSSIKGYKGL